MCTKLCAVCFITVVVAAAAAAPPAIESVAPATRYKAVEYPRLKGIPGLSDALLAMHLTLYQGYVKNANLLSEKLAALGQFIAGVAHELNNPLQAVLGHVELLRRQGRIPPGIRRELSLVFREADRAARIVDNLLVFAGGHTATLRPIALNAVVTQTLALRAAACRAAGIDIVRRLDESQPRVAGNRLLLQQALFNVLINAEQELAAWGGGRIEVSTRVPAGGDVVRVQVRDTGPGIAAAALPRLFEPFFTTKDVGRGTGLGLAITYGIVKDHRGTLTAGNHPDGGAVFTIDLPVSR